jgi:hypothetical protein
MHAPVLLFFFFPFVFTWGIAAILFIPYFLPSIIALIRRSNNAGGIFLLNLLLGWTFIGWIVSLVWAIASRNTNNTYIVNNNYSNNTQPYTQSQQSPYQQSQQPPYQQSQQSPYQQSQQPPYQQPNNPPYQAPPGYNPPPYNSEPNSADQSRATHQTSPTLRRPGSPQ